MFKAKLELELKKQLKQDVQLETPPVREFGDLALPCFKLKKSSIDVQKSIKLPNYIEKTEIKGPYLNFFIKKEVKAKVILTEKIKKAKPKKTIVIEYPSPNTNKPLHLGHIRNIVTGQSISKIKEFTGNKVIQVNLLNDRGIHICKAMLAYNKWGKNKQPNKKSDHYVGDFYVLFNKNKSDQLEQETQEMLKKWENKDKATRLLWKKINTWAEKGFEETYKSFNLKFKKTYKESQIYEKGKDIVVKSYKKDLFKKDEKGNIIAELEQYKLPNKILLRSDGTAIYITQDIALANEKYNNFKPNESIILTGSEQIMAFQQLFQVLKILGYKFNNVHIPYGMVYLPEGRMKSREGTIVDADDLVAEMINLSKQEIIKRYDHLPKKEIEKRSYQIGLGALRFFILKLDTIKDMTYDPNQSISFEGETGPYIQYVHARCCSILKNQKLKSKIDYNLLSIKEEQHLIDQLGMFAEIVEQASEQNKPSQIANYLIKLSQAFNEFYHVCPVLKAEPKLRDARLLLVSKTREMIKQGLDLLVIESPEEM